MRNGAFSDKVLCAVARRVTARLVGAWQVRKVPFEKILKGLKTDLNFINIGALKSFPLADIYQRGAAAYTFMAAKTRGATGLGRRFFVTSGLAPGR